MSSKTRAMISVRSGYKNGSYYNSYADCKAFTFYKKSVLHRSKFFCFYYEKSFSQVELETEEVLKKKHDGGEKVDK